MCTIAEVLRGLKMKTGFSSVELFRKYLWYALRERKFDPDTVADLIHLRQQLSLTDDEVSPYTVSMLSDGLGALAGCLSRKPCNLLYSALWVFRGPVPFATWAMTCSATCTL